MKRLVNLKPEVVIRNFNRGQELHKWQIVMMHKNEVVRKLMIVSSVNIKPLQE